MREQLITILQEYLDHQGVEMNDEKFTEILNQLDDEVNYFVGSLVPQIVEEHL